MRFLLVLLVLTVGATAQTTAINLTDGKVVPAKSLRRQGDNILAMVDVPNEAPREVSIGLDKIKKIDFPEPGALRMAADLTSQGKAADALTQLETPIRYYEPFRDAPGAWWPQLALRKLQALVALERDGEADKLVSQILDRSSDAGIRAATNIQVGVMTSRKDLARGWKIIEPAIAGTKDAESLAPAYVIKGRYMLENKQWEDAVLAFVQIPVFYGNEKTLMPQALLGRGRAHLNSAMNDLLDPKELQSDLQSAKTALNDLIKTYPNSPEAKDAAPELEKVLRREKALAP